MKNYFIVIVLLTILFLLFSCAAGPNTMKQSKKVNTGSAGFWKGLWHGIIAPVTFIISLFNKKINIYEVHNNGNWYNFGFLLGLSIIFGGSGGGAGSRACRKR